MEPGDQLVMKVELLCIKRRRFGKMQARAQVNEQLVAEERDLALKHAREIIKSGR